MTIQVDSFMLGAIVATVVWAACAVGYQTGWRHRGEDQPAPAQRAERKEPAK